MATGWLGAPPPVGRRFGERSPPRAPRGPRRLNRHAARARPRPRDAHRRDGRRSDAAAGAPPARWDPVATVAIDEDALAATGRWPRPRAPRMGRRPRPRVEGVGGGHGVGNAPANEGAHGRAREDRPGRPARLDRPRSKANRAGPLPYGRSAATLPTIAPPPRRSTAFASPPEPRPRRPRSRRSRRCGWSPRRRTSPPR